MDRFFDQPEFEMISMDDISSLPEIQQFFVTGLAFEHAIFTMMNHSALDLAKQKYDCMRCTDEDLRKTEIDWSKNLKAPPMPEWRWDNFSESQRDELRIHVAAIVANYLSHTAWSQLLEAEVATLDNLIRYLGVLNGIALSSIDDERYRQNLRDHLSSIELSKRDLAIYLVGTLRFAVESVPVLLEKMNQAATAFGESHVSVDCVLADVLKVVSSERGRRELRRRRKREAA
jgi:hypothetical protein